MIANAKTDNNTDRKLTMEYQCFGTQAQQTIHNDAVNVDLQGDNYSKPIRNSPLFFII